MYINKINKLKNLIEKIKNDITLPLISDFLDWFLEKLNIHFNKETPNLKLKKGQIFFVNLGQNIGSELNKKRPCIIYSIKNANFGNTVVIFPLKSYKGKKINDFQIFIKGSSENGLQKDSVIDISGIRQIDKKRILTKKGMIEKEIIQKIDNKILKIFGIKK